MNVDFIFIFKYCCKCKLSARSVTIPTYLRNNSWTQLAIRWVEHLASVLLYYCDAPVSC